MFENKPLTQNERNKLNPYYLDVITHYERTTNRPFTRDEMIVLKLLVEFAAPAAIKSMITNLYKKYPDNFTSLSYIYQPTKNIFSKKKRSAN